MRAWLGSSLLLVVVLVGGPAISHAMCDVIPAATTEQRSGLGTLDRPFASPGDLVGVEVVEAICDSESAGILPQPGNHVVTVLFTPPQGFSSGPTHAVVLAEDCAAPELVDEIATCNGQLGGTVPFQRVVCLPANGPSEPPTFLVSQLEEGRRRLFFRFPDTDALFGAPADGRTLSGPAKIVVTRLGTPLACDLATARCASNLAGRGLVACIDEFYDLDGSCGTDKLDANFPHFTALPVPNDYAAVCSGPPPCLGTASELRFTTDRSGNVLVPWDYEKVLVRKDGVPIARIGRGETSFAPFSTAAGTIQVPRKRFLSSHASAGLRLPPIFTPLADPDAAATLFGSIDAARGVMRLARRSPEFVECVGGVNPGTPCTVGEDCTSGVCGTATCRNELTRANTGVPCTNDEDCTAGTECGPSLFEFRDRFSEGGVGPVVVPSAIYEVALQQSVPLDGLIEARDVFAFVLNESVDGVDANGDGDTDDFTITLTSRRDGTPQPIGTGGSSGRAVSRFASPPYTFPAVVAEEGFVALLESEARENKTLFPVSGDSNGDDDAIDYHLRAFKLGDPSELLSSQELIGFSGPLLNGQPLVLSDGMLYALAIEFAGLRFTPRRMSVDTARVQTGAGTTSRDPAISGWRTQVAFSSDAPLDRVTTDTNGVSDIYVRNRDVDYLGATDIPGNSNTRRVSLSTTGAQGNGPSRLPSTCEEARNIAFESDATNLEADRGILDTNGATDIFMRNRDVIWDFVFEAGPSDVFTDRVSVTSSGAQSTPLNCSGTRYGSTAPSVSVFPEGFSEGRYVVFQSYATNLDATTADTNGACAGSIATAGQDVFVHDRDFDGDFNYTETGLGSRRTVRVSVRSNGTQHSGNCYTVGASGGTTSRNPSISSNGQFVAFDCDSSLHADDTNGFIDVYLHDRDADGDSIPDETDALARNTILVSKPLPGRICDGPSFLNQVHPTGGFVVFESDCSLLVEGDRNGVRDVFVYDRARDQIQRVSESQFGEEANGASWNGELTPSGFIFTFESDASNLVADDLGGSPDRFFSVPRLKAMVRLGNARVTESTSTVMMAAAEQAVSTSLPLIAADTNGAQDIYVDAISQFDSCLDFPICEVLQEDLNGDGDVGDPILIALDMRAEDVPSSMVVLNSAALASVAGGAAAFLRPEFDFTGSEVVYLTPPERGAVDLNLDGDYVDLVVHLYGGRGFGGAQNLGRAASDVKLSDDIAVAMVSEADNVGSPFAPSGVLNGDGDVLDHVVQVHDRGDPGSWTNLAFAADQIGAAGPFAAYIVPEAGQGTLLNADGDLADRILRLYDHGTASNLPVVDEGGRAQAAEEFVLGSDLVAFRTPELASCSDPDASNCAAPATCAVASCDLNGDGDCCDDGLQVFDLVNLELQNSGSSVTPCQLEACDPRVPYRVALGTVRFLTKESDEGRDLNHDGDEVDLLVQLFNLRRRTVEVIGELAPVPPGQEEAGTSINPVENLSAEDETSLSQAFLSRGLCTEDFGTPCTTSSDCAPGEACGAPSSTCHRQGDTCRVGVPEDCAPSETCEEIFVVVSAADTDGDEVVDPIDNCLRAFNPDQADQDLDGRGDACDVVVCGNLVVDAPEEQCDDGRHCADGASCSDDAQCAGIGDERCGPRDGDGCTRFCRVGGCFGDVNLDGDVDGDDAAAFTTTPGCFPCAAPLCTRTCDGNGDGRVNNADALALQQVLGTSCPPPPSPTSEVSSTGRGCGLGGEVALMLPPLVWLSRLGRRRVAGVS